jgi:neuron navigator 2
VDPVANLGLASDSVLRYEVGEISRTVHQANPELLPYGYLVGDITSIRILLKHGAESGAVDALAFETLTPKAILQRYVSLLQDHRRVILCGPPGTGKTHLAGRLGSFLCHMSGRQGRPLLSFRSFKIERGRLDAFTAFLEGLVAECRAGPPLMVLILDNLQFVADLDEVLSQHLPLSPEAGPIIIGTMVQAAGSVASTNLQLKHNFRWILCANHMEPVRGLLSRYLRRKLLSVEVETRTHNGDSARITEWVAHVAAAVNKFLESHASPEATLGPVHFLSCPLDPAEAKLWFINLWNLLVVPHLLDSVREGLQLYGRRVSWEDPLQLVADSWPWPHHHADMDSFVRIRPEDVGYEASQAALRPVSGAPMEGTAVEDPLFNMLMTLQEAANTESGDL